MSRVGRERRRVAALCVEIRAASEVGSKPKCTIALEHFPKALAVKFCEVQAYIRLKLVGLLVCRNTILMAV